MSEQIFIDSPRQILSEALALHIQKELGYSCHIYHESLGKDAIHDENGEKTLYLIDCAEIKNRDVWKRVKGTVSENGYNLMALFNVPADVDEDYEIEAYTLGCKGFFPENIALNLFIKGISAIFEGQVWFSRNVLNNFGKIKDTMSIQKQRDIELTSREKEILVLIASGAQNYEIADKLCISHHTVKSHIYNIFQKIDVPNRFQAALWAANHRIGIPRPM